MSKTKYDRFVGDIEMLKLELDTIKAKRNELLPEFEKLNDKIDSGRSLCESERIKLAGLQEKAKILLEMGNVIAGMLIDAMKEDIEKKKSEKNDKKGGEL